MTVALDSAGAAAAGQYPRGAPTHPALIDAHYDLATRYHLVNVPSAVWIDERAPSRARPRSPSAPCAPTRGRGSRRTTPQTPDRVIDAMMANVDHTGRYAAAVRDWVAKGAASPWVLRPEEVVERSRPRSTEAAMAAAEFDIAQHLHRAGQGRDAVAHFLRAHELDPTNWSYIREALSLADPEWGAVYPRNLLAEVEAVGVESFYPSLDL